MCHFDLGLHCLPMSHKMMQGLYRLTKKVSMISKYHNHKLQTNLRHCEEELQDIYNNKTSKKQQKQTHQKISVAPQSRLRTMFLNWEELPGYNCFPASCIISSQQPIKKCVTASFGCSQRASLGIFQVL